MPLVAFAALCLGAIIVFVVNRRHYRDVPELLDRWAEERGFRIVEWRLVGSNTGSMSCGFVHLRGPIYRLVVKDGDGRARKATVCLDGFFLHLLRRGSPAVEILWDAFNEPSPRVLPGDSASVGPAILEREVGDGSARARRDFGLARLRRRIGAVLSTPARVGMIAAWSSAARLGFKKRFDGLKEPKAVSIRSGTFAGRSVNSPPGRWSRPSIPWIAGSSGIPRRCARRNDSPGIRRPGSRAAGCRRFLGVVGRVEGDRSCGCSRDDAG